MSEITVNDYELEQKRYLLHLLEQRSEEHQQSLLKRYGVKLPSELESKITFPVFNRKELGEDFSANAFYFKLIIEILVRDADLKSIKSKEEIERLSDELLLIYRNEQSEIILKVLLMCAFCKENKEPYMLKYSEGSLYLYYLLGYIPFNPIELGIRYQFLLGTTERENILKDINIEVRPEFQIKLEDYIASLDMNYHPYLEPQEDDGAICLHFINRNKDVSHLVKEVKGSIYFVIKDKYSLFDEGIRITIFPNTLLYQFKEIIDSGASIDINKAIAYAKEQFKQMNLPAFDINHYISTISEQYASKDDEEESIDPFYDRDSVFNIFLKCGEENAYNVAQDVRKGKSKNSIFVREFSHHLNQPYMKLVNIRYLPCRAYSAQEGYINLITMYYSRPEK